jgi:hypothetical protein
MLTGCGRSAPKAAAPAPDPAAGLDAACRPVVDYTTAHPFPLEHFAPALATADQLRRIAPYQLGLHDALARTWTAMAALPPPTGRETTWQRWLTQLPAARRIDDDQATAARTGDVALWRRTLSAAETEHADFVRAWLALKVSAPACTAAFGL